MCCHGDAQSRDLAVGILSKSEIMDSTGIVLSQQFFSVSRCVLCPIKLHDVL